MIAIIIGVIVLLAGIALGKADPQFKQYLGAIRTVGIAIILAGLAFASVYQIEPGQVGVQKLFGKVNNKTLESGLNIINPLAEVVTFDIRTQNYTMSGIIDDGAQATDDTSRSTPYFRGSWHRL